jgi:hypothetical protein
MYSDFFIVVAVAVMVYGTGTIIYEHTRDWVVSVMINGSEVVVFKQDQSTIDRWCGRVVIMCSLFIITMFSWHTVKQCVELQEKLQVVQQSKQVSEPSYVSMVAEYKTADGHSVTVSLPHGGRTLSGRAGSSGQPAVSTGRCPVAVASGYAGVAAVFGTELPFSTGADGTVSIGRDGKAGTRLQETF